MAKQSGQILFEGTLGNLTGYQMNGKHYLKRKTSVSKRKIMTDRRYENTRRNATCFGEAQKIASTVYVEYKRSIMYREYEGSQLKAHSSQLRVWYPLRNRAQQLVRKQVPKAEILNMLRSEFIKQQVVVEPPITVNCKPQTQKLHYETINLGRIINPGVIYELTDQLAAYNSLVNNLLNPASKVPAYKEEKKQVEKVLEKFRR